MEVGDTGSSNMKAGMVSMIYFDHTAYLYKILSPVVDICFFSNLFVGLTVADLVFPW